jgi:hypothetical protein
MLLYVIEFPNGKRYFGITDRTLNIRWSNHLSDARSGKNRPICRALRRYPEARIRPLVVGDRDYIHKLERRAVAAYGTTDRKFGYNFGLGGETNPMLGNRHTEEAKSKIGAASSARTRTPESNAKTSASLKGRSFSAGRCAAISAATKAAMATPEMRAKLSAAQTGVKRSPSAKKRVLTAQHRANIGAAGRGLKRSPETCERIRLAKLATWARKRAVAG